MITDKLGSYGAARKDMGLKFEHRQHKGLNNRAENSHQPTRRRERIMKMLWGVRRAWQTWRRPQTVGAPHAKVERLQPVRHDI